MRQYAAIKRPEEAAKAATQEKTDPIASKINEPDVNTESTLFFMISGAAIFLIVSLGMYLSIKVNGDSNA